MIATRVGTDRLLDTDEYQCRRCGIVRKFGGSASEGRPTHCRDCKDVLAYRERKPRKPPRQYPTHLTDEECRVARNAYKSGDRSPETVIAAREFWRRRDIERRTRLRESWRNEQ